MGLLDFLFKDDDFEYRRDIPENIRRDMHRMLDKILDMEDEGNSSYLSIKLRRKMDSAREIYSMRKYKKDNYDR